VNVVLEKKEHDARMVFKHEGTVNVPCDLTVKILIYQYKGNEIVSSVWRHITMIMRNCWFFHLEI
jgi:hypothetical protein